MVLARATSGLDPLIGRIEEQAAIHDALTRSRLVSITGLGGTGKTRLARAVAATMATDIPTWFVDLATISHASEVPGAIAAAVGVGESATEDLAAAVARSLARGPTLVVLDNFEHVLEARRFVTDLLEAVPSLRLIATSRVRLGVPGELAMPLAPLPLPSGPGDLATVPAGQLFLRRARERGADPDFGEADAAAVVAICRRLDGLPLALELAAAWTPLLGPRAILRRLEAGRLELASGASTRQGSLEGVVDATLELLTPEDRAVFEVLGVFAGDFDEEAAEAVTGTTPILPVLRRLEAAAVVAVTIAADGEPRFGMLETIRAIARARLAARPERALVRRGFVEHFAAGAQRAADGLRDLHPAPSLAWMTHEIANLRAAFDLAVDLHDATLAVQLAMTMATYGVRSGSVRESLARLDRAMTLGPVPAGIRSEALCAVVNMRFMLGDAAGIADLAREAVALATEAGDSRRLARALLALGSYGPPADAMSALEAGADLAERTGYQWAATVAVDNLASLYADEGRFGEALERFRSAARSAQKAGDQDGIAHALSNIGDLSLQLGRPDEGLAPAGRAVEMLRRSWPGSPTLAMALGTLAATQALTGGPAAAYRSLNEAAEVAHAAEADVARDDVLESAAVVLAAEDPDLAARILGCLDEIADGNGPRSARPVRQATASRLRTAVGARRFDRERQAGRETDPGVLFAEVERSAAAAAVAKARLAAEFGTFTSREMEVLERLARGRSDQDIADDLGISPKTASVHVANIKGKLGVASRLEASLRARELVGDPQRSDRSGLPKAAPR